MVERFPHESVPDGAVFGPHHFYLGILIVIVVCLMAYDIESKSRPWAISGLALLSLFGFALTWPYYPVVGAFSVLALLAVMTLFAVVGPFWWQSGLVVRGVLLVGLLVAWDDALSHAFGWRTPLDALWVEHLYPYVADPQVPPDLRLPWDPQLLVDLEALLAEKFGDALAVVPL